MEHIIVITSILAASYFIVWPIIGTIWDELEERKLDKRLREKFHGK